MANLQSLMNDLPISDIANKLGVDTAKIEQALGNLLPSLVGGMEQKAKDPSGQTVLQKTVQKYVSGEASTVQPDESEGESIASDALGENKDAVVERVAESTGTDKNLIQKLLPMVAPFVVAWLASRISKGQVRDGEGNGNVLGDLAGHLGDLLGGENR